MRNIYTSSAKNLETTEHSQAATKLQHTQTLITKYCTTVNIPTNYYCIIPNTQGRIQDLPKRVDHASTECEPIMEI